MKKTKRSGLIGSSPTKDDAYINALLKPEMNPWKRIAKAGNIERVLEHHAAGRIVLAQVTVEKLKAAHAALDGDPEIHHEMLIETDPADVENGPHPSETTA